MVCFFQPDCKIDNMPKECATWKHHKTGKNLTDQLTIVTFSLCRKLFHTLLDNFSILSEGKWASLAKVSIVVPKNSSVVQVQGPTVFCDFNGIPVFLHKLVKVSRSALEAL